VAAVPSGLSLTLPQDIKKKAEVQKEVKLTLCLINYHAKKTYGEVEASNQRRLYPYVSLPVPIG
jgi:hypothetical protein